MPRQRDGSSRTATLEELTTSQRLDKWLWFARIVKSRTLAASLVQNGRVRVNREKTDKPSQLVRIGDVVTVSVHRKIKVLRVLETGARRGPAKEAVLLYEDISPAIEVPKQGTKPGETVGTSAVSFEPGTGRPTKKDRRALDRLRQADD